MDGPTFVFIIAFAIIGSIIQFFFFRAIIISAMKQVFIDLQTANAAIRVVAIEDPESLTHSADASAAPTRPGPSPMPRIGNACSPKAWRRKISNKACVSAR